MRTCVIFNPTAKGGRARAFSATLKSMAPDCALKPTWAAGTAEPLATEAVKEGYEVIIAAGGDGTVNEVINGIGAVRDGWQQAQLGLLPLGTVNVFAKELGIPSRLSDAWQVIRGAETRTVDVGVARFQKAGQTVSRYFAQLAGAGIDAGAVESVDLALKRRVGPLAYVWSLLQVLRRPTPMIQVRFGGQVTTGPLVLVGNGRFYAGRFPAFPSASLSDAQLDVCVFRSVNWLALLRVAVAWAVGRTHPSGVQHFQAREFSLESNARVPLEIEGDAAGELPASFSMLPARLRVIVPPSV